MFNLRRIVMYGFKVCSLRVYQTVTVVYSVLSCLFTFRVSSDSGLLTNSVHKQISVEEESPEVVKLLKAKRPPQSLAPATTPGMCCLLLSFCPFNFC